MALTDIATAKQFRDELVTLELTTKARRKEVDRIIADDERYNSSQFVLDKLNDVAVVDIQTAYNTAESTYTGA